jgi:hypothetical protein
MIPIKKITKTDFVGPYTEYVYADGHVETEPVGRPQSREDVIRASKQNGSQVDRLRAFRKCAAALGELGETYRSLPDDRAAVRRTVTNGGELTDG